MTDFSWIDICELERITPGTGVAAMVGNQQLAIVRPASGDQVYAVSNFDPFSKAFVIARGIVGDRNGIPKIASPMYKQSFDLRNGVCLDDATVVLEHFPARVIGGRIEVAIDTTGQS
jgi:nitrite reductase (NADH) small subunit